MFWLPYYKNIEKFDDISNKTVEIWWLKKTKKNTYIFSHFEKTFSQLTKFSQKTKPGGGDGKGVRTRPVLSSFSLFSRKGLFLFFCLRLPRLVCCCPVLVLWVFCPHSLSLSLSLSFSPSFCVCWRRLQQEFVA